MKLIKIPGLNREDFLDDADMCLFEHYLNTLV